jgi:hypothetical protein
MTDMSVEMWRILSWMVIDRADGTLAMAKLIDFYIPANFRKAEHWVPAAHRGKVIEFCLQAQKPD